MKIMPCCCVRMNSRFRLFITVKKCAQEGFAAHYESLKILGEY